jgi:hypothetical protein
MNIASFYLVSKLLYALVCNFRREKCGWMILHIVVETVQSHIYTSPTEPTVGLYGTLR